MLRALRAMLVGAALVAGASLAPPVSEAATPEEVRAALETVRAERMQWELPQVEEPRGRRRLPFTLPIFEVLLYSLLAASVIALSLFIASHIRSRNPARAAAGADDEPAAGVRLTTNPRGLADLAAREGDFAAAVHLLLLGTIEEIRASLGYDAPASLTSREIVARAPLPAGAQPPLAALVAAVERSHFGARPVVEADYRRCLAWHDDLLRACAGGAPRGAERAAPGGSGG
jgi:hypothetical protein